MHWILRTMIFMRKCRIDLLMGPSTSMREGPKWLQAQLRRPKRRRDPPLPRGQTGRPTNVPRVRSRDSPNRNPTPRAWTDATLLVSDVVQWRDRVDTPPATIWLPMLGLLGGTCGEPVSIWLRDYPPDVTCAVHRFLLAHLWNGQVCEIVGRSDARGWPEKSARLSWLSSTPLGHAACQPGSPVVDRPQAGQQDPCGPHRLGIRTC